MAQGQAGYDHRQIHTHERARINERRREQATRPELFRNSINQRRHYHLTTPAANALLGKCSAGGWLRQAAKIRGFLLKRKKKDV